MSYSMVQVDELPGEGPTGGVRFVRRNLGAEAFGINWFELPPNAEGFEHNEEETQQEEVNVIIDGSGVYRVEGEEIPVPRGTVLRFDPETTRVPVAGPEGMTMVAVGARRGSYEPKRTVEDMHTIELNDQEGADVCGASIPYLDELRARGGRCAAPDQVADREASAATGLSVVRILIWNLRPTR